TIVKPWSRHRQGNTPVSMAKTWERDDVVCVIDMSWVLLSVQEYLVLYVLPDSYVDPEYKDYGGELFLNGEVIPRTPVWTPERQRRIVRFMTPILRYNDRTRNVRGRESMH
ncbi:hypothetical protein HID58_009802, partial [Brassica napus]